MSWVLNIEEFVGNEEIFWVSVVPFDKKDDSEKNKGIEDGQEEDDGESYIFKVFFKVLILAGRIEIES